MLRSLEYHEVFSSFISKYSVKKSRGDKIRQRMDKWGGEKMDQWAEDSDNLSKLTRKDWKNVRKNIREEYGKKVVNYHRKMTRQNAKEARRME